MTSLCCVLSLMLPVVGCGLDAGDDELLEATEDAPGEAATIEVAPAAPPQATSRKAESAPTRQFLGPAFTEAPLWPHGGAGGTYTGHVTPPAVIYAVRVRSGSYVDAMGFAWYQPTRWDNLYQAGDAWGNTPLYGGSGGGDNGWWYCPAGKGVIGIRGNSGSYLDRVGVICGDVTNPDPYSPYNTYSPLWGAGGGGWFGEDRCGAGRLVDSFNVRSGTLIDNLQAICINAH
ncbi:MAG TPA: hypothetical protein PKU97_15315 [Kofleriaceae bacterium]|nr:hypothetical protein [Kofleriaceae bacterium]